MKCMVQIHVISQEALDSCTTIKHFLELPISESTVKLELNHRWVSMCGQIFGDSIDPRLITDDAPVTNIRYRAWVDSPAQPQHLTFFYPHTLSTRLFVCGAPVLLKLSRWVEDSERKSPGLRGFAKHVIWRMCVLV
jgi:hypothetical protein